MEETTEVIAQREGREGKTTTEWPATRWQQEWRNRRNVGWGNKEKTREL